MAEIDVAAERLPIASGPRTLRVIGSLLLRRPGALAVVVGLMIAVSAAGLAAPWALGHLVDLVVGHRATDADLVWLAGVLVGAGLFAAAGEGFGIVLTSRLFERILADLREEFVAAALRLPPARVERAGTGDLVSRASDDVARVSETIPDILPSVGIAGFTIATTLAGMGALDWRFAVMLVLLVPLYVLIVRWYVRVAPVVYAGERIAQAERAQHVLAGLRGRDTVLAFRLSRQHRERIAQSSWRVVRWTLRERILLNQFTARLNLGEFLGLAIVLLTGFWLVGEHRVSVGATTTAALLWMRLIEPIGGLLMVLDEVQAGSASLARIVGVVDAAPPVAAVASPPHRDGPGPVAALCGVHFGYEAGPPVLHGVSMEIAAGEKVALVGTSGAGKTTVAALLAGIQEASEGLVRRPEKTMLVAQETTLFHCSLGDNLRLARPAASDDDLWAALRTVSAEGWARGLDGALDAPVAEVLTPAQSQQVALARLVLADPDLALLDEATAEADSADAGLLEEAAVAAVQGRAALVVAHRLSQARVCDRILVMEHGRIIENGRHDALVAAGGRYARLWQIWSRGRPQ